MARTVSVSSDATRSQDFVGCLLAMFGVQLREVVEIHQHDRQRRLLLLILGKSSRQFVIEALSIWQSGYQVRHGCRGLGADGFGLLIELQPSLGQLPRQVFVDYHDFGHGIDHRAVLGLLASRPHCDQFTADLFDAAHVPADARGNVVRQVVQTLEPLQRLTCMSAAFDEPGGGPAGRPPQREAERKSSTTSATA